MSVCVAKYHDQLISIRRHLHTMPEEGWSEFTTTNFIVEKLKEYGYQVLLGTKVINPENCLGRSQKVVDAGIAYARKNGVSEDFLKATEGYTGCCGILDTGRPGPTLAVRFDIDCVPVTESTEQDHIPQSEGFESTRPGLMHACGHDAHMSTGLALAHWVADHKDELKGRIKFLFQPAEEGTGGALAMIKDGLFEHFPMDEIYGMHNWTDVEPGTFSVKSGAAMAGSDFFTIKLHGKGAHGSAPQLSADAALAASLVTVALQQIVARNVAPLDSAVVSVTKIHTGSAFNIIPQEAELGGCTRFFSSATGALLRRRIEEVDVSTAAACGVKAEVEFESIYAVLDNVPQLAEAMKKAAAAVVGEAKTQWAANPQMGSEDFSFMLEKVPGAYCFLGGQAPHGATNLHNPSFDFDDRVLPTGAAIWVELAMERLAV